MYNNNKNKTLQYKCEGGVVLPECFMTVSIVPLIEVVRNCLYIFSHRNTHKMIIQQCFTHKHTHFLTAFCLNKIIKWKFWNLISIGNVWIQKRYEKCVFKIPKLEKIQNYEKVIIMSHNYLLTLHFVAEKTSIMLQKSTYKNYKGAPICTA